MRTYRSLVALAVLLASPAFAQSQHRDNPTVRETLRWMQTTLESGAGDYEVYHEVRSVRLDDFVGCKVHFSYSDHQEPYANGEPAPEPNKTYRADYFFSLGEIDPTNITFSKGLGLRADNKGVYEIPSFFTIRTRNDEKKITTTLFGEPATGSKPDDTFVTFAVEGEDDYVVRFAEAFKHAVEACGGKPSLFADSHAHGSDEQAPLEAGGVAAQSVPPRKGTQDPWAVVSQTATEEFHLRGECAKLAGKVENDNPDYDLDDLVTWSSNYSVKDNRCYVLESSYNRRLGLRIKSLYDGQTEETLASVKDNGKLSGEVGMIFNSAFVPDCSPVSDCGYSLAEKYIGERMRLNDDAPYSARNAPAQKSPAPSVAEAPAKPIALDISRVVPLPGVSVSPSRQQRPQSAPPPKDIPAIAKAANGAVVSIVMSDKDGNPIAQGSGFLVSKDGLILTNYHVIAEGTSALVKLPDGAFYIVDGVVAFDKARDVAVIKAHGENFGTLTLGDSDRVQVGQEVVAIGNPLSLESTVSNGIVSSIRTVEDEGGKYLQITAPISPGSSGGPLFNMAGEVVGITTMYIKGGENLNFAIPINDAKPLLLQADSAKLQNLPNEPEPTEAQTHEGNTPPSPPSPAAPAAQTPAAARDFFEQLNDAGAFSDDPVEYVCFSDDQDSDAFFTFGAAAYDERYARAAAPPSVTYMHFLSDDDMKDLSRGEQKFFRKGGRILLQYVYEKGVKVDMRRYDWAGGSWRSSIQTAPYTFAIRQLSIESETMRYIQTMKTEITDHGTLDEHAEDGVCEKIPNPK